MRVRFAAPDAEAGAEDIAAVSPFTELEVGGGPAGAEHHRLEQRVQVPLSVALRDQVYVT